jgi:hypothetical protein
MSHGSKGNKIAIQAVFALLAIAAFLFAFTNAKPAKVSAAVTSFQEYSVKYVCGIPTVEAQREAVKPGNYATAINIHNPNQNPNTPPTQFTKHAVRALPEDIPPLPPGPPVGEVLPPDFAMEVDCQNIRDLLHLPHDTTFIKGFVVILEPTGMTPFDVIGVYSSEPPPGQTGISGMGLEVLPYSPKIVTK